MTRALPRNGKRALSLRAQWDGGQAETCEGSHHSIGAVAGGDGEHCSRSVRIQFVTDQVAGPTIDELYGYTPRRNRQPHRPHNPSVEPKNVNPREVGYNGTSASHLLQQILPAYYLSP